MEIATLKAVPLREIWEGEATHFTPWLAEEDNLALLAETLGLRLELTAVEKQIGSFVADIVAHDLERNVPVLIENQLAPTDHRHLGQILTYAAGLNAETIIWISERIREEHRAAIDWLNEISGTHFRFFAIEVQAWTIDGKVAAPQFRIASKPNDWSKRASSSAESQSAELSESQSLWRGYWQGLIDHAGARIPGLAKRAAYKGNWQCGPAKRLSPTANVDFNASCPREGLRAEAYIGGAHAKLVYAELAACRDEIEANFGGKLDWEEMPAGQDSRISVYLRGVKADREGRSDRQYDWFADNLSRLHAAVIPHLERMDLQAMIENLDTAEGE